MASDPTPKKSSPKKTRAEKKKKMQEDMKKELTESFASKGVKMREVAARAADAEKLGERLEADLKVQMYQRRIQIIQQKEQAIRNTKREAKRIRSDIDFREVDEKKKIDYDALKKRTEIDRKERKKKMDLRFEINHDRIQAQRVKPITESRRQVGLLDRKEREEKAKIDAEIRKMKTDLEIDTQQSKFQVEALSRQKRDTATSEERSKIKQVELEADAKLRALDDEAERMRADISRKKKDVREGKKSVEGE